MDRSLFCQVLIAKVIVSALFRAQQENLQFHHMKNKTKKAKSFWTGCKLIIPYAVFVPQSVCCSATAFPLQKEDSCPWDAGLGSSSLSLQWSTIRMKHALEHSCPSSFELFSLGFQSTYSVGDAQVIPKLAELTVAHPFPGEGNRTHFTLEEFSQLEKLSTLGEVGLLPSQAFS